MENKYYNRKFSVSYKVQINNFVHCYQQTIYLFPNDTEDDLIRKIKSKIRPYQSPNVIYTYEEVPI